MTEDATLSDFLATGDGADESEGATDDERGGDEERDGGHVRGGKDQRPVEVEPEGGDEADLRAGDVEPAAATYAWGEYTCDGCGERTDRVWRDGDSLVCPDCKPW